MAECIVDEVAGGAGSIYLLVLGCGWVPKMDGASGGGKGQPAVVKHGDGANVSWESWGAGDQLAGPGTPGVDSAILTAHEDEGLRGVDVDRTEGHLLVGFGELAYELVGDQVRDTRPVPGPDHAGSAEVKIDVTPDGGAAVEEVPLLGRDVEGHYFALAVDRQNGGRGGMKTNGAVVCFVVAEGAALAGVGGREHGEVSIGDG